MTSRNHLKLLAMAVGAWALFWVIGLPDYYQQYSFRVMFVLTSLLVVGSVWGGWRSISNAKPEQRMSIAAWMSFYFTVPFALLDVSYCAIYLGHGASYLVSYWYLSSFYVIPWIIWMPMPALLQRRDARGAAVTARS